MEEKEPLNENEKATLKYSKEFEKEIEESKVDI